MTLLKTSIILAALTLLTAVPLPAGEKAEHGFLNKVYKSADGDFKYVVYVPEEYKGDTAYPVILFLHGAGERGTDGLKQASVGLGKAIRDKIKKKEAFPFIAVFPQSVKSWTAGAPDAKHALAILDEVEKTFKTDKSQVYLTGLSLGGFGTWSIAAAHPDRWAAIVPVCGGGNPKTVEKIKDIPCWCFHGDADTAVRVKRSREMIEALKSAGASPRYDEYPGVGHNSWDNAYGTAELYTWMLKQKRKQ
jgi:predicted peptidase